MNTFDQPTVNELTEKWHPEFPFSLYFFFFPITKYFHMCVYWQLFSLATRLKLFLKCTFYPTDVSKRVDSAGCAIAVLISSFSLSSLRCPVFRRLREEAEKRKRPSWNELKSRKADRESPGDAKQHSTTTKNSRDQPEPGMINPAYEESEDGTSSAATPQTKHTTQ